MPATSTPRHRRARGRLAPRMALAWSILVFAASAAALAVTVVAWLAPADVVERTIDVAAGSHVRVVVEGDVSDPKVRMAPEGSSDEGTTYDVAGRQAIAEADATEAGRWLVVAETGDNTNVRVSVTATPAESSPLAEVSATDAEEGHVTVQFKTRPAEKGQSAELPWQVIAKPVDEGSAEPLVVAYGKTKRGDPVECDVPVADALDASVRWALVVSVKDGDDVTTAVAGRTNR